jgi:hypothetical protein
MLSNGALLFFCSSSALLLLLFFCSSSALLLLFFRSSNGSLQVQCVEVRCPMSPLFLREYMNGELNSARQRALLYVTNPRKVGTMAPSVTSSVRHR